MPVVDVAPDELRELTGHEEKDDEQLRSDLFDLGLEFEGWTDDEEFQLEFAPDRLDRLSVEGVARSLRYQYGDARGVYLPSVNDADWTIEVTDQPEKRPYITGAIVRGLDMGEDALESLIQLQEKLHATMGRKRAKGAIGVHDLTMLKGSPATDEGRANKSVTYTSVDPDAESFVPLESNEEMTPAEVLDEHPTGEAYADLVESFDRYPAIYDDIGLFSFPPVINGSRTEVTTGSRDLFIEMTGTDQWTIDHMLSIVCYALAARGGQIERVEVEYADDTSGEYAGQTFPRPDFSVKTKTVAHDRIESILGVSLSTEEVIDCAERAGLDAEHTADDAYEVEIPPYRVDVLHPLDVIDDIGRAYGFNELEPTYPDVSTVGGRHERSRLEDAARDALVGLGFEDLLNFHMITETENYGRMVSKDPDVSGLAGDLLEPAKAHAIREEGMRLSEVFDLANVSDDSAAVVDDAIEMLSGVYDYDVGSRLGFTKPVTIMEPYSEDYTMLRTWALPSLLMVLENNTHRAYPQDLAEIGLAAHVDDSQNTGVSEHRTVAGVLARTDASYEDAKARLQAIADSFGADLETPATDHPSFIDGRTADIVLDGESVGVVGEIHPAVLVDHDLELPVAAFEFRLDGLA